MLDNRIYTFLELCNVMNYHKTAENLSMTQPAVTQHIKYLENLYGCKLFQYSNKQLSKTVKCIELERYARSIISLNQVVENKLSAVEKIKINIGATRTIGEYWLDMMLSQILDNHRYEVNIIIDNTENLLKKLNHFELDILLLEGYVDKEKYDHEKISTEEIVGICGQSHDFAGKEIPLQEIFKENIIIREKGSGTRAIFENFLGKNGYSVEMFGNKSTISSNKLIEYGVEKNLAISFVYGVIPFKNEKLATFHIKENKIYHEFNYVFLNREKAEEIIKLLFLQE